MPTDTPVTLPDASTIAMLLSLLLQIPPETVGLKVVDAVIQTDEAPLIEPASSPDCALPVKLSKVRRHSPRYPAVLENKLFFILTCF